MGPAEKKLADVAGFTPEGLEAKADAWRASYAKVDLLLEQLDASAKEARAGWEAGTDAEAAQAAFVQKRAHLEEYRERMKQAQLAVSEAKRGLVKAQSNYVNLPKVGPAPTAPDPVDASATKEERDDHNDNVKSYNAASANHAGQIKAREEAAAAAVQDLDLTMKAAQSKLTVAAPPVPDKTGGGEPPAPTSGPGPSSGPVVGGSTSVGHLIARGPKGPKGDDGGLVGDGPADEPGMDLGGSGGDGATPTIDPGAGSGAGGGLGQVGGIGGGGIGGVAASAGAIGAGRSILGRLAGAGGSASAASGRTAGMQKGSTLGARSASGSAGAQSGSQSAGSRGAGQQAGTRGSGGPGQSGGRSSAQSGGRGGAQSGGRGAGAQSGGRGGAQSGGRGTQSGSRGAGSKSGAGSGAGRGGARGKGEEKDQTLNHLAFDEQWIDDEDTAPGVIA